MCIRDRVGPTLHTIKVQLKHTHIHMYAGVCSNAYNWGQYKSVLIKIVNYCGPTRSAQNVSHQSVKIEA